MRYSDYDKSIYTSEDIIKYKRLFEKDIADKQKELSEFVDRANERIKWIEECEINNDYSILGRLYKDGRNKNVLLIIRYKDGTQRDERYSFNKIAEAKKKLSELQEKHSNVDWSKFELDI
jgi:hypothetical protein